MRTYHMRPATPEDMDAMAPHLRPEDAMEIAAFGLTPSQGLHISLHHSLWARVGLYQGEIACVWGLGSVSLLGGHGGPWCLTTPLVQRSPRQFWNTSRQQIDEMLDCFPHLSVWVDDRYHACHRWLRRLGFQPGAALPIHQVPFHQWELSRKPAPMIGFMPEDGVIGLPPEPGWGHAPDPL